MFRYVGRRLVHSLWVIAALSVLVFLMVHASGDPARALAPIDASPEDIANIRVQYGLDRPLPVQFVGFVKGALRGDMGESFKFRRPAFEVVVERLPATVTLALSSFTLSVLVALPLGVLTAVNAFGIADTLGSGLAFLSIAMPSFWLGMIVILVFSDRLHWLPPSGIGGISHLIMPSVTMSAYSIGLISRLLRADLRETLSKDYILVARSKGLPQRVVVLRHALKNCLIPTVTVLGLELGTMLSGSVVVETVFAWPGVGWLMIQAVEARDLPLVRAVVMVVGTTFVVINVMVDILYSYLDPRIKYD